MDLGPIKMIKPSFTAVDAWNKAISIFWAGGTQQGESCRWTTSKNFKNFNRDPLNSDLPDPVATQDGKIRSVNKKSSQTEFMTIQASEETRHLLEPQTNPKVKLATLTNQGSVHCLARM